MSNNNETNQDSITETVNENSDSRIASRKLVLLACIATLIFSGVMNGALDGRWANQSQLEEHGALLKQIPENIGDWVLTDETPLDANAQAILQCYGSLTRYYKNKITGEEVGLLIIYGPRGPVAVHVPEVCYSSAGTFPSGPPVAKALDENDGNRFWVTQFEQSRSGKSAFEVWYAWSTGTDWEAASHPRFWMTHQLYKIQVAGPKSSEPNEKSPVERFLAVFVPVLKNGAVLPLQ